MVFAIQVAAIHLLFLPYRRDRDETVAASPPGADPPGDLSPAEAGFLLAAGSRVDWNQALGCLFDLAERGVVSVEQVSRGKNARIGQEFVLKLESRSVNLQPFEQGLLEVLFLGEAGLEEVVLLNEVGSRYAARRRRFEGPLLQALRAGGLLDAGREYARRFVRLLGWFAALAGALSLAIGLWATLTRGWWPFLLISAGFLAGALVAFLQAGSFSFCTDQGQAAAVTWRVYARSITYPSPGASLAGEASRNDPILAYAAAFGLIHEWIRWMKKKISAPLPGWFQVDPFGSEGAGLVSFLAFLESAAALSGPPAAFHPGQAETS